MAEQSEKSLVTILIPNIKGQLALVSKFCADNGINILRLTLSAADGEDKIQKIIAYLEGKRETVNEICKKLLEVDTIIKVVNFQTNSEYIEKEICLVKILMNNPKFSSVSNTVADCNGKTIFSSANATIFAMEDNEEKVNDFVSKIAKLTLDIDISRSGMVAMSVDKNVDSIIKSDL
ncbi:hypothetical protein FACS1894152_2170 [Bacilli bacterium]|nr:hypothetical protein FACS1894152_2170 [Bacilli bacterium]